MNEAVVEALEPKAALDFYLQRGVRPDGRRLDQSRPLRLTLKPHESAGTFGSALAQLGPTQVLGTATLQIGTPDLSAPLEGDLVVHVNLAPFLANADAGSSGVVSGSTQRARAERGQLAADTVRQSLLASGCLKLSDLSLSPYTAAWQLSLDLLVLDDGGSLLDCCFAAAIATLRTIRLPATIQPEKIEGSRDSSNCGAIQIAAGQPWWDRTPLPVYKSLSSLTCRVWTPASTASESAVEAAKDGTTGSAGSSSSNGGKSSGPCLIVDPDRREEAELPATVTVVFACSTPEVASGGAVADSDAPSRVAAVTLELCGVYSRRGVPLSCITQCTSLSKAHALTAFQCLEAASSAAEARRLAAKKEAENPDGGSKRPTSDSSSGGATRTSLAASGLKSEGSGGSKGKKHSTGGDSSQKSARVQSKKK